MSLLMTMLSSFFRDRTNIETFLGGPDETGRDTCPLCLAGRGRAGYVVSSTCNVDASTTWSSNSPDSSEPQGRAGWRNWRDKVWFFGCMPLERAVCRRVDTCGVLWILTSVASPGLPAGLGSGLDCRQGPRNAEKASAACWSDDGPYTLLVNATSGLVVRAVIMPSAACSHVGCSIEWKRHARMVSESFYGHPNRGGGHAGNPEGFQQHL